MHINSPDERFVYIILSELAYVYVSLNLLYKFLLRILEDDHKCPLLIRYAHGSSYLYTCRLQIGPSCVIIWRTAVGKKNEKLMCMPGFYILDKGFCLL